MSLDIKEFDKITGRTGKSDANNEVMLLAKMIQSSSEGSLRFESSQMALMSEMTLDGLIVSMLKKIDALESEVSSMKSDKLIDQSGVPVADLEAEVLLLKDRMFQSETHHLAAETGLDVTKFEGDVSTQMKALETLADMVGDAKYPQIGDLTAAHWGDGVGGNLPVSWKEAINRIAARLVAGGSGPLV